MKPRRYRPGQSRWHAQTYLAWAFSFIFLFAVTVAWMTGYTRWPLPVVYGVASLITVVAYARDKARAQRGLWRIPENTLHLLELVGGWPGALVAQWTIFHKNRKVSYQMVFWGIVIVHFVALGCCVQGADGAGFVERLSAVGQPKVTVEILD